MKDEIMTNVKLSLIGSAIGAAIAVVINVGAVLIKHWFSKE